MNEFLIAAFYRFIPIPAQELHEIRQKIEALAETHQVLGLLILGPEGFNATLGAQAHLAPPFVQALHELLGVKPQSIKWSRASAPGFVDFKVKVRQEIVTLGRPDLIPAAEDHHVNPEEWDALASQANTFLLDTRNNYEVQIGKFTGAQHLDTREFAEFPEKLKKAGLDKGATYLIYCTGGIRCEKAILAMRDQGYEKVFQLNGGILNYLEKVPQGSWEGECFVFDRRLAVDAELKPSTRFRFCPHCGQPAQKTLDCELCATPTSICDSCVDGEAWLKTCSKNCAHHKRLGHHSSKPHHQELNKGRI